TVGSIDMATPYGTWSMCTEVLCYLGGGTEAQGPGRRDAREEESIQRGADRHGAAPGGGGNAGGRDLQEAGGDGDHLLSVEEEVRGPGRVGAARAQAAQGRESEAEAARGRSLAGQEHLAGGVAKKMVTPTQVRAVVAWARDSYRLSERRACQAVGANRSSVRYRSVRQSRDTLRGRLRELAAVRVSWGYK